MTSENYEASSARTCKRCGKMFSAALSDKYVYCSKCSPTMNPIKNEMQPAEIYERLKIIRNEMFFNHAEDYIAFDSAVEIVKNHVEVVSKKWERMINPYGELEGFICPCGHSSQSATKFCSTCGAIMSGGERKDGNEK